MASILMASQFIAIFCCALFSGAAVYINLVEHPARMKCGTLLAATVFPISYQRATIMQVTLAIIGFIFAILAWLLSSNIGWLIGGVLLGLVIPFTLLFMMSINKKLTNIYLDKQSDSTRQLLLIWGKLHAIRSVLSIVSLLFMVVANNDFL